MAAIGLSIAISLGFCAASSLNLLYSARLRSGDFLFQTAVSSGSDYSDRIVIIAIDDESLEELGYFSSWPRNLYAGVIDRLAAAKSRVTVFDVLFSESAPGDGELASAIARAGNVLLPAMRTGIMGGSVGYVTDEFQEPLSLLQAGAKVAHANVTTDQLIVRSLPVTVRIGDETLPALSIAAVATYLRRPQALEYSETGQISLAGRIIPASKTGELLINYAGKGNFTTVSFVDVLNDRVDPGLFTDRIVLIGATASALGDRYSTPLGPIISGIYIHAYTINMILSNSFLKPAPAGAGFAAIVVMALFASLAVWRFRPLWSSLSTLGMLLFFIIIVATAFDRGIVLDFLYPSLALAGGFVATSLYSISSEQSQKKELTRTFGKYVSDAVARKILAAVDQDALVLGGQEQEATVLFADVRGFSQFAESTTPQVLVAALNVYLTAAVGAVLKYDGTINKFGGDSILAIWNAPSACTDHALTALSAAREMQRAISGLRRENAGLAKLEFGIGVNTGQVIAGNMGSPDRLEYTVIGDAVNVAARLTSQTPGGRIWLGSRTYELTRDAINARPLPPLEVRGKKEPLTAYELVDSP